MLASISILSPVKNEEKYIAEMIQSVIDQTYTNWQLIIVDDGSNDRTVECVKAFSDPRIQVFQNKGVGIVDALITGCEAATGKWITRMDGDDVMPPYKLEELVNIQAGRQKVVATGRVKYFSAEPISAGYVSYQDWLNEVCSTAAFNENMYRECVVASGNWLALRTDLLEIGFPSTLQYPEDYDLVFQWYAANFTFCGSNKVTHLWREHPDRTSRNSEVYDQSSFFELKMNYWLQLENDSDKLVVLLGLNPKAKLVAKKLQAQGHGFVWLSNNKAHINQLSEGVKLKSFTDFAFDSKKQLVLNAVYPEKAARIKMEQFFCDLKFAKGKGYWCL